MKIGYFLASEEWSPCDLIEQAAKSQDAGFDGLWISDHYHPWNHAQGHSGFVWSTIGGISQAAPGMPVTTAVTCPTIRIHPAVIAQAAATSAVLLNGQFRLGVGAGEALNEHILGDRWPGAEERLEMLEEAIEVIRKLWRGGPQTHRGRHYRVEHAEIFDLPEEPVPVIVSGFGRKSIELSARVGDGFCTVQPDASAVETWRSHGGGDKTVQGGMKVCWGQDADACRAAVHRLWPSDALPGELAQVLPTPEHFEQASQLVTSEMLADVPCGPDVEAHLGAIQAYEDAGFDELYINQIGPGQDLFFDAYRTQILPELAGVRNG